MVRAAAACYSALEMRSWARVTWGAALAALLLGSIDAGSARSQEDDMDEPGAQEEVRDGGAAAGPAAGASEAERLAWLSARIEALIAERARLADARVGIAIADLQSGKLLYQRAAEEGFNVASNAKLITSLAALALLGPGFEFRTTVHAEVVDADGTVRGDLFVRGHGDPTLGTDGLTELVDDLAHAGVTAIRGGLVIDESYFDDHRSPPHYDAQPKEQAYFRAPIGAVSLNFNQVGVVVTPSGTGAGPAAVVADPPNDYVKIIGAVETVAEGRTRIRIDSKETKTNLEIHISGQIGADEAPRRYKRRIPDPVQYFGATLRTLLEQRGIRVGKKRVRTGTVPERAPEIVTRTSPPLAEVLRGLGKYSNNYVAEMVLKTIGAEVTAQGTRPATWEDGLGAVRAFLAETVGLKPGSYRYENGSGLYDSNQLSPAQIVRILEAGYRDFRYGPDLTSEMSIAGIDGTLRRRLVENAATGRVRGKTGTLAQVSALSGYAAVDSRRVLAFSICINDFPKKYRAKRQARSLQDEIAEALILFLGGTP